MSSARNSGDLWSLVLRPGPVDERALWRALTADDPSGGLDYRSRLLAHEALVTLAGRWGEEVLRRRLGASGDPERLLRLWGEQFDEVGFPSLQHRIVEATSPETILQLLREMGTRLRGPAQITIGGSSSLLLADLIARRTEDIDVVDELPEAVRAEPALVDELANRYGLRLTHFASHFLPDGWQARARSLGRFGARLDARVLDPLDVLAGKLFSRRAKDLDDLRAAWPLVDREALSDRVAGATTRLRADAGLRAAAQQNWYVLTGEDELP